MSFGLKTFNLVEETGNEATSGTIKVFYEAKEVDDLIRSLKAKNKCLEKKYNIVVLSKNEEVAKQVDGNAEYWKKLCEKRTQMYLEEQAARASVAEQLQIEIHKPFPYIEKLKVMKVALLREMAFRSRFESIVLHRQAEEAYDFKTGEKLHKKAIRKYRQEILFFKKADELEKELLGENED